MPTKLPEVLEVDISGLNTGDFLRAKDLKLSEGVVLAVDPELAICHVTSPAAKAVATDEESEG